MSTFPFYGLFCGVPVLSVCVFFFGALTLLFRGSRLWTWALFFLVFLVGWGASWFWFIAVGVLGTILGVPMVRRSLLSKYLMQLMKKMKIVPSISPTERAALEAGSVWIEREFFSGNPNFSKMLKEPYPELSDEEKAFLDGPVEKVCEMTPEWKIWKSRRIPEEIWTVLRKEKFFGLMIPKKYGGLGFSAAANSAVIQKLNSRSVPISITVMVPNSLGPAELLHRFGTDKQKNYYLPRLARGEEIPCFGLTEVRAGSDAGSIQSEGVLFKDEKGKLCIRLNFNKRWITLAAVSTLMGIAFRLNDPKNLLGRGEYLGITLALVPTNTPGVEVGKRHDPLVVPFYNCPIRGKDVVVSADAIIGGIEKAGCGWQMLMDCLGAGRGISLPAQACGGAKLGTRLVSAHSLIRKQFGVALGEFEGIQEPLSRIGSRTYIMEATRKLTLGALNRGIAPSVVTGIVKYNTTELGRKVINDVMDIMGGQAISRGPRNVISNYYLTSPIGITVEGANILTRTMIVFGQGLLRAHPFAYEEVRSLESGDLVGFDHALWGHMYHIAHVSVRTVLLSLSRGLLARSPVSGEVAPYYRKLSWASASFAFLSNVSMMLLGGSLKFRERITGRFADILSWLYMGFAVLRRFEQEGRPQEDLSFVHYSMRYALIEIQHAFDGILCNYPSPIGKWVFQKVFSVWSRFNAFESNIPDYLGKKIARFMMTDSAQRDRLTDGIYLPKDPEDAVGRIEHAFKIIYQANEAERKIRRAIRKHQLPKKRIYLVLDQAFEKGILNEKETDALRKAAAARWDAIQVDEFTEEEYRSLAGAEKSTHARDLVVGGLKYQPVTSPKAP